MKYGILLITIVLLFACNSSHKKGNTAIENGITLNEGEKWTINEEMIPHIMESEKELDNYIKSKNTDFRMLANKMKEQNSNLIKSCTMDGTAHDELHKWLHPHMELIDNLEKAKNLDESQLIINQLVQSFDTFSNYFN